MRCLSAKNFTRILFMGDTTHRDLYNEFVSFLSGKLPGTTPDLALPDQVLPSES
jgi:hypothetical protein